MWEDYGSSKAYQQLDLQISSGNDVFSDRMEFFRKDVPEIINKAKKKVNEMNYRLSERLYFFQEKTFIIDI